MAHTGKSKKIKLAAIGDIHVKEFDKGKWTGMFRHASEIADILLLCGDLTDNGDINEAKTLADELTACKIPVVAVLGNHDYDKSQQIEIKKLLTNEMVHVLEGESVVIDHIGFAGLKGFGGGFDSAMLSLFGENELKAFVTEAVDAALKLDAALARLDNDHTDLKKIVLLHYSPIKDTIIGEPEEIFPFLGCSRLAEPLNRRNVIAAFHGHAHLGKLEGTTYTGVKVFNVSTTVLQKAKIAEQFFIFEV